MTYRPGRDDWFRRLRQQEAGKPQKPLGGKAYGSIPHLPGSKFGDRRDRGLKVAIHTNGAFPEHVPGLIGEVDKVSLDIKAAWEHYYDVTDLNCARHVQASLARYRDAYAAGTLPEFEVVHTVIRGHEADVPAVAAAAEGVDLVLQQGVLGREPPLTLAELCAVADSLARPVRIRTKEIGEVLYQDGVFTVAGSMTVTDPERLQAYYKGGISGRT